ncbi:MAG: DEAD/DEAH box helicase [archaeon]|nr:DEAD/DEAH box helicase [archaeon]
MTSFEDLGVNVALLDVMKDMGWTEPTPVQCEAVPIGMAGNDLIAKAQTGTGKTGAYSMILLSRIGKGREIPSALVIAPTRELAMQVEVEIRKLSRKSGHYSVAVYGGAPYEKQINALRRGSDIVVGTPGRLKDLIEKEALDLSNVTEVVLDEADSMLDMGFADELEFIMAQVPEKHQTLMFSATLNWEVERLASEMLESPAKVDISGDTPTTGLTKQYIIPCRKNEKKEILYEILRNGTPKTIVFFSTKVMVDTVFEELKEKGARVGTLHGDMPQKRRERVIGDFRDNHLLILLATDVASRGLDVSDVDLVVNFDLPIEPETYLHRIGRTGRAGKAGVSISIVNPRDRKLVRMCEEEADTEMERITVEELEPIEVEHEPVYRERPTREKKMRPERHRNNDRRRDRSSDERIDRFSNEREGFATVEISLGKNDGVKRSDIADFIKQRADLPEDAIGKVGLKDETSFVEVSLDHFDYIIENLADCEYEGKAITIKEAPRKKSFQDAAPAESRGDETSGDEESERPRREFRDRDDRRGYGRDRGYGDRRGGYGRDRGYGDRPRRDFGDRPRREFRDDSGDGERREFRDRPRRDFEDRPRRDFGDRPRRDFRDRDDRGYGDRPRREFRDRDERPRRDFGDRPRRDFGDRPRRDFEDRPRREFRDDSGDGERREFRDRPRRDFEDRPRRDFGDRPRREFRDRDERPRRDFGDRPRRDRDDRGHGDRPRRDFGDRPRRDFDGDGDRPQKPKRYGSNRDSPRNRYGSNRDKPKDRRGKY